MRRSKRRRHDQLGHLAADGLVGAVAEDGLGRVVPLDHAPVVPHGNDRVKRRLEHCTQTRLAGPHSVLCLSSRNELPHLAADDTHRLEESFVGLAQLA